VRTGCGVQAQWYQMWQPHWDDTTSGSGSQSLHPAVVTQETLLNLSLLDFVYIVKELADAGSFLDNLSPPFSSVKTLVQEKLFRGFPLTDFKML